MLTGFFEGHRAMVQRWGTCFDGFLVMGQSAVVLFFGVCSSARHFSSRRMAFSIS